MNVRRKRSMIKRKKCCKRWYWIEKRRRKYKCQSKTRTTSNRDSVRSTSSELFWSSTSLTCDLSSQHQLNKICIEANWKWLSTNDSAILFNNDTQVLFHPRVSSSTQVILADRPIPSYGKHYWEIYMPAVYGTSIMFGITTKQQRMTSEKFTNLIGIDQNGWALSHHGILWHNGLSRRYLDEPLELLKPILIGLEFNADERTLSYYINNRPMGVAFDSIPRNIELYPAVSSTSAQSTMILKHACQICTSLREICIKSIKTNILIHDRMPYLLPNHLIQQIIE